MAQIAVEHAEAASTQAHSAPLGMGAFALTTFVVSVANIGATSSSFAGLTFFGGLALLLAGMWEYRKGTALSATAFTLYGVLWLSYSNYGIFASASSGASSGYYFLAWTILSFVFLLSSLRTSGVFIAFFLLFTLTMLALSIGHYAGGSSTWQSIGGWLGIITAAIATYAALASLLHSEKSMFQLPTFPMS